MGIISAEVTLDDTYSVRPAEPGEEGVVLDVLADAAAWLRERGIEQWPRRFAVESVTDRIAAGEVLLVGAGGAVVATLVVTDSEPDLWPDRREGAAYVSRLAVTRGAAGSGLGERLLDWVQDRVTARGGDALRLATSRHNPGLRRYYEGLGFVHVADAHRARWPTSLYERRGTHRRD
ncbi:MAG TPA: GNAT family N-acetyltransferase [Microlunatus sp.]|nr:GNAT family N-acetyltransferase [Microlunatus sp.]